MEIVCLPLTLRELSHELRTPLTGILGSATILNDEDLTPTQKSCIKDIIASSQMLLNLANRLQTARKLNISNDIIDKNSL